GEVGHHLVAPGHEDGQLRLAVQPVLGRAVEPVQGNDHGRGQGERGLGPVQELLGLRLVLGQPDDVRLQAVFGQPAGVLVQGADHLQPGARDLVDEDQEARRLLGLGAELDLLAGGRAGEGVDLEGLQLLARSRAGDDVLPDGGGEADQGPGHQGRRESAGARPYFTTMSSAFHCLPLLVMVMRYSWVRGGYQVTPMMSPPALSATTTLPLASLTSNFSSMTGSWSPSTITQARWFPRKVSRNW